MPNGNVEALSLKAVQSLLEERTGLRAAAQPEAFEAVCAELCQTLELTLPELRARLETDESLLHELATRFTVHETHFFRVSPQIEAIKAVIFPALADSAAELRSLRLWSAGCSTGEEAYTLAMLLIDAPYLQSWDLSVLGTDLHAGALEVARSGSYGPWSFRDTSPELRLRHFEQQASGWVPNAALRRITRFRELNLLASDWRLRERFGLILCRNVTIYFAPQTAQRVYLRLAAHLHRTGWLVLGPSDPPPLPSTLKAAGLEPQFVAGAVLYQKTTAQPRLVLPRSENVSLRRPTQRPKAPQGAVSTQPGPVTSAVDGSWLQLGLQQLEAGDTSGALAALRRATYLQPDSALAQFALAQALFQNGQAQRARVALRQAQRWLPALQLEGAEVGAGYSVQDLARAIAALSVMLEP